MHRRPIRTQRFNQQRMGALSDWNGDLIRRAMGRREKAIETSPSLFVAHPGGLREAWLRTHRGPSPPLTCLMTSRLSRSRAIAPQGDITNYEGSGIS